MTPTRTATRTPSPTAPPGPVLTFFGVASASGVLDSPIETTPEGTPIYERPLGFGFIIVVEGRRGGDNQNVGMSSFDYDPNDPTVRPDLQIIVDHAIGEPTTEVCDNVLPEFGGVPPAQSFAVTQPISDAMNDFGCRFVDGSGSPGGRRSDQACVLQRDGEFRFANSQSQVQFCATIPRLLAFRKGDTKISVRLRNAAGVVGEVRHIIIRSLS